MDTYTDIANNIREVQYLLQKMRNEIDCCRKATLIVKTSLRELATALAEEEAEKLHMAAQDESVPLMDSDIVPKFDFVPENTTLEATSLLEMSSPFEPELTVTHMMVTVSSEVFHGNFSLFFLPQNIGVGRTAYLRLGGNSCPLAVCENDSVILTSVFVTKMASVGRWCLTQPFKVVPVFVPPPAKPPDKSINTLQMLDSHLISKILKYVILHGLEGVLVVERSDFDLLSLVRSEHLPTWISSLQIEVTFRIPSIDFLPPWVLDMSEIKQGNEQLWFETPFCYLNSTCNSTVCENAPEIFHSDFNMLWPLNVSRFTLFDWKYVHLMLEWYLRFLNSYILLWIKENVQRLNVWWLFDLACHSPIRLETETYVLGDLEDVRLVSLNMGPLAAAAKYRGDFEKILRAMMKEVEEIDITIILFIFEIYIAFSAGKTKGLVEAATLLKHMPYRVRLRCTDNIRRHEFQQYVEKDAAIGKRSYIAEPSLADAIKNFRRLEVKYDSHQDDKDLVMAALLLVQYIVSLYLPDKATDFGDEVYANVRVRLASQPEEIGNRERKRIQLEVEVHALAREKDKASKTHVAGGSFTVIRDTPVGDLNKQTKITLFFKEYQLEFFEERRWKDMIQKHLKFTFIYCHMSMTKLDNTIMESGGLLDRFMNCIRILVFHVCADIYFYISWELSGRRSSYKEVKQLIVIRDLWSLVTLEENGQWLVIETNTIIDIHKLPSINMSSYIESIAKGVSTVSISYSSSHWEMMHTGRNLITSVFKNVFQSPGFVALQWERLQRISSLHWKIVESEVEKRKQGELKTKFEVLCKVIKSVLGLTGVGKTDFIQALTDQFFDDENFLNLIDMHEPREQHSMGRLNIGDPPGYVGHKEGGQITEVRQQLYYVVPLEVIDKGHPYEYMFAKLLSVLLIQLDAISMFNPLAHYMVRRVIQLQMKDASDCLSIRIVALAVSDAAWDNVLSQSYDQTHDVRPIKKCLEKKVVTLLSKTPFWNDRDENLTVFIEATFGGHGLSYQVEKNGEHVCASFKLKGILFLFLAEFRQVNYHQLQYTELSLHMYGPWKTISSISHELLTFDLEDKVAFERGSNVTGCGAKEAEQDAERCIKEGITATMKRMRGRAAESRCRATLDIATSRITTSAGPQNQAAVAQ